MYVSAAPGATAFGVRGTPSARRCLAGRGDPRQIGLRVHHRRAARGFLPRLAADARTAAGALALLGTRRATCRVGVSVHPRGCHRLRIPARRAMSTNLFTGAETTSQPWSTVLSDIVWITR